MNRPRTPRQLPPHDARERRLIDALRRSGIAVRHGWLVDTRRKRRYPHGRIVEMERPA